VPGCIRIVVPEAIAATADWSCDTVDTLTTCPVGAGSAGAAGGVI